MLKILYRWHIKSRIFKLKKGTPFLQNRSEKRSLINESKKRPVFIAGDKAYTYERPQKKRHYRYFFFGFLIVLALAWFVIKSYQGWGIFSQ